jgi:7-cyano-7-deazaguanine synthase
MIARPAVILLSGGLDSATAAALAREEGFALHALTIDYGQRHRFELEAARRVGEALGVKQHAVMKVNLGQFGGSALTAGIAVPKGRSAEEMSQGIPVTYVPARNTVFLALALAYAETMEAADIFLGVNALDYSGYPDCRPEFIAAFQRLANLATKAGVEGTLKFTLHAPLVSMSKAEIIRCGTELGVDYGLTHSCYDPDSHGVACGRCDACLLRQKGFAEAGLKDPLPYQTPWKIPPPYWKRRRKVEGGVFTDD